jgi:lambda repressor-like predicted transcriptional regulator
VGAFVGGEGGEKLADASPGGFEGACVELAQEGLELGENLFDRFGVGRVSQQEQKLSPSGPNGAGNEALIDGGGGNSRRNPDHSLHRLLARAYRYNDMAMRSDGKTMRQLAAEAGVVRSYFTRILRLSFLAPDIVKAILCDRHPIELTAKRLANELRLPIAWDEQRALLGFN